MFFHSFELHQTKNFIVEVLFKWSTEFGELTLAHNLTWAQNYSMKEVILGFFNFNIYFFSMTVTELQSRYFVCSQEYSKQDSKLSRALTFPIKRLKKIGKNMNWGHVKLFCKWFGEVCRRGNRWDPYDSVWLFYLWYYCSNLMNVCMSGIA